MIPQVLKPREISVIRENETLRIEWNDGTTCEYAWAFLRRKCPCATCGKQKQEVGAEGWKPAKSQVTIRDIKPVGRYALRFEWQDGHNTGLYSYEYLFSLCSEKD